MTHMKQFPVLVILLTASLGACNPKPTADQQLATPEPASPTPRPPDPDDRTEIQRRFVNVINESIKKAEPSLQKPVTREVNDGMHRFFIEYTGKLEYDIKKTDSIVTPYLGTVSWNIRWHYDDVESWPQTLNAHYAYQEGQWIMKDLVRNVDGKDYPADEYFPLFR
jgi:hypothetical protein